MNINKLLGLFDKKDKQKIGLLFLAVLLMGLAEVASIASIIPFLVVVTDPSRITSSVYLSSLYSALSLSADYQFVFILGLSVFVLLVLSNLLAAFTAWALLSFSFRQGAQLSTRLLAQYLSEPYAFYLHQHSSELSKNILWHTTKLVVGVLVSGLLATAKTMVILCIFVLLFMVNPSLALSVGGTLVGAYALVYYFVYKRLSKAGAMGSWAHGKQAQCLSEAFGGIKEIKLLHCESAFIQRFNLFANQYAQAEAINQLTPQVTRHFIETIAFGGILLIMLYLIGVQHDLTHALPMIGLYALAGYRLMPLVQQVFNGLSQVRYNIASLGVIADTLRSSQPLDNQKIFNSPLKYTEKITIEKLSFQYQNTHHAVLSNINIEIAKNTMVGFVGPTGSGKTTLVDLLLGLLKPTEGIIKIDDVILSDDNIAQWQSQIGYVSQNIFLIDDTVKNNIALGVNPADIDQQALEHAAKLANIHEFIINDLPQGYDSFVGQNGIRLSGGQKQRIGIARALYHNPQVLVFDEGTSALDGRTEHEIMHAIHMLADHKTILIIAHRPTTIEQCDKIYIFDQGQIIEKIGEAVA